MTEIELLEQILVEIEKLNNSLIMVCAIIIFEFFVNQFWRKR